MTDLATNVHYYGDNPDILRRSLPDAVDTQSTVDSARFDEEKVPNHESRPIGRLLIRWL